ncbi:site-specific DNA-methyltransferase [Paenibacillus alba]|uniref:DNA methyltransferase n=1 Tax=Paenibacillus alba TaxID=1197127 RepID=UPI001564C0CE|nr:site-specific DNA-methyltransferase [Paenibacillus alba]NQX64571.1 site-specific DNA-methyltransferase [Paenibacillus alba]
MNLYHGDNFDIMKKLIDEGYAGSFDMIYLDGPFNSGRIFTRKIRGTNVELVDPWHELKSIQLYDRPELYLDDYHKRIELARELLSTSGVLVLQISQKEGHYLKVLLDAIFGREHFLCEVIWKMAEKPYPLRDQFGLSHESLFFYAKTDNYMKHNRLLFPSIWDDVGFYEELGEEDTFYPSQKPQKLMRRILEATTKRGDLIGDFYCGSGSMPFMAQAMGRRWIASDTSWQAVEVTKERLYGIGVRPHIFRIKGNLPADMEGCWEVPYINEDGIHESQKVRIPLPTLVFQDNRFVLEHEDWRTWCLYNVLHVTLREGKHMFEWDRIQERIDELLSLPKETYMLESHRGKDGDIRINDIFGCDYYYHNSKYKLSIPEII